MVRKITEEQIQYDGRSTPLSVRTVYDRIKSSNSSLNRRSKRLLEDSIERVIEVVRETELDDESSSASDGEGDRAVAVAEVRGVQMFLETSTDSWARAGQYDE